MMELLIGADPELFVADMAGGLVSAEDMVEGTKDMPFVVEGGAVQVDGMALEFNIDPAKNVNEFLSKINSVQAILHDMIGRDRYNLLANPSVVFTQAVMDKTSPLSKMLGCEPDYNAWWDGDVNPTPVSNGNLRTGAGHVHIGWTKNEDEGDPQHFFDCVDLIKQLDCSLGIHSILWDGDHIRRTMYGKAGAFRVKPYGVEYRVLSNAWLRSDELVNHVYTVATKATNDWFNGIQYVDVFGEDISLAINEGNTDAASHFSSELLRKFDIPSPEEIAYV